jgi:hypothetical protein
VHERAGRRDMPDTIGPIIMADVPLTSTVKFGEPSARIAITEARPL